MIENSFEVFLKTPTYDSKKEQLDQHLKSLHQIMEKDSEVIDYFASGAPELSAA